MNRIISEFWNKWVLRIDFDAQESIKEDLNGIIETYEDELWECFTNNDSDEEILKAIMNKINKS